MVCEVSPLDIPLLIGTIESRHGGLRGADPISFLWDSPGKTCVGKQQRASFHVAWIGSWRVLSDDGGEPSTLNRMNVER